MGDYRASRSLSLSLISFLHFLFMLSACGGHTRCLLTVASCNLSDITVYPRTNSADAATLLIKASVQLNQPVGRLQGPFGVTYSVSRVQSPFCFCRPIKVLYSRKYRLWSHIMRPESFPSMQRKQRTVAEIHRPTTVRIVEPANSVSLPLWAATARIYRRHLLLLPTGKAKGHSIRAVLCRDGIMTFSTLLKPTKTCKL